MMHFKKIQATTFHSTYFLEHFISLQLSLKVSVEARKFLADDVSLGRWRITTKPNKSCLVGIAGPQKQTTKVAYRRLGAWLDYCDQHPERHGEDFSRHLEMFPGLVLGSIIVISILSTMVRILAGI